MPASDSYDVVICGGAVVGSSVAYWLMAEPAFTGSVLVVEQDPSYAKCSTTLSAGAIRQQFSTPANIEMSTFGIAFLKDIGSYLSVEGDAPELSFHEGGFLFLATEAGRAILGANHRVQERYGADNALLGPEELEERFPWLNADGIALGSLGLSNEGWFDPWALLQGYRKKALSLGAEYRADKVAGVSVADGRVTGVTLATGGEVACGAVVNAAGIRANDVARMAGLAVPVEPRKRIVYVIDCREEVAGCPLLVNPNGVWVRPEGPNFITGLTPPDGYDPPCDDFEIDYRWFDEVVWPTLAERIPAFEAIKLVNAWAGHYAYNTLDQNAVLGPHPEVGNFHFANGFSGHGLQQSPAVGRGIMEQIVHGGWRSLDLSTFGYERVLSSAPVKELNVV
ncbi:MAG: FAD-binding oxidoreductase [Alphaproteobacteria bacterium]|nr:FAD-binding oxidoreductase [Alphaproteobacteria bacterium]